jgi:hypothetical protein
MRLCLNSYALKAGPDEDELVGQCLKKALNAAMSTIQTHFESSQTDLALSFATDVSGPVSNLLLIDLVDPLTPSAMLGGI